MFFLLYLLFLEFEMISLGCGLLDDFNIFLPVFEILCKLGVLVLISEFDLYTFFLGDSDVYILFSFGGSDNKYELFLVDIELY